MNQTTQNGTEKTRGFIILGVSLALLLGMVVLKSRVK